MYEHIIAFRHIGARKRHTFFSVLAVALAVAVIVVMMSMLSGFQNQLIESTVEQSPHITVNPSKNEDDLYLYRHFTDQIIGMEGIAAASPVILKPGAMEYKNNRAGVSIEGIDPEAEHATMRAGEHIIEGSFDALSYVYHGVVIGNRLAEEMELSMGDRASLVAPDGRSTTVEVVGIIHTGTPRDENIVYARIDKIQDFFDEKGVVSLIRVRVVDINEADDLAALIEMNTDLEALSWIEVNRELFQLLNTQRTLMWIFYLLIYTIAGFGIANTLVTVVMDKKREIGMLMTMGASRKSITSVFVIEAAILGIIGVLLGCILGYLTAVAIGLYRIELPQEVYFGIAEIPMDVQLSNFIIAAFFAIVVNMIAGVFPAKQASQLDPVEAIEGE